MTSNTLLGVQVKRLLSNLSRHGTEHLAEIENDLLQTNVLLSEAIEKLAASFMSIHETVFAQQEAVNRLLSGTTATPEIAEGLKARHEEIGRHVNGAITGLQFQDMTSQLIERNVKRVGGLRDVVDQVGSSSAAIPAQNGEEQLVAALNDINVVLEERNAKLEGALRKAVCQTHMESGDVELF